MMCRVRVVLPEDSGPKISGDAPAGDAAHAEGQIQADGAGGDDGDLDMGVIGQLHDGALGRTCGSMVESAVPRASARASSGVRAGFLAIGLLQKKRDDWLCSLAKGGRQGNLFRLPGPRPRQAAKRAASVGIRPSFDNAIERFQTEIVLEPRRFAACLGEGEPLALLSMPVRPYGLTGTALRAAFRSRSAVDARKAPACLLGRSCLVFRCFPR